MPNIRLPETMNITNTPNLTRFASLLAILTALTTVSRAQTTANWTGTAGDNDWNNGLNWDVGSPPADPTTNAVIGATFTVNYIAPMVAGSFGSLTLGSVLNINATNFVVGASGNGAATVSGSGTRLFVNNGGAVSLTNGGLTLDTSAAAVLSGGSLSIQGALRLGNSSTAGSLGMMTNTGANLSAGSTSINAGGASSTSLLVIGGGLNNLGNVTIRRFGGSSAPALGVDGLAISNGVVTMTSLVVNNNNSYASMLVTGGETTNTGSFIVGQQTGANSRASRYYQSGGLVVSTLSDGVRLCVSNGTQTAAYSVIGGTNIVEKFVLGDSTNGAPSVVANFTNAGSVYVGSGGFTTNNVTSFTIALNNNGTTGAKADWSTSLPLLLNSGTHIFNAADIAGAAHNITLNGPVRGGGGLNKSGAGVLTLNGTNVYTGGTTVSQGTLALGATGSISNVTQITVSSGAVLDVSAVSGAALLGSQTLIGSGSIAGPLTAFSGSTLRPGGLLNAGTLTFSSSMTESGGVNNSLDLSQDPTGNTTANDLLNIAGDLNLSGTNAIQITALNGTLPVGAAYKLIQYGGSFNGGLTNFSLSGANGVLSNNASAKAIYLVIQTVVRAPTNVVWLGGLAANAWDTQSSSNWLNGTSRDVFVPGDNARFDNTGATNPIVTVVGSVGPGSLVVDTASNYTFTGSGSIDGSDGLVKTNTGTLTILTTNGYPGSTLIGGGSLEVIRLANGGSPSSLGASANDPSNLQFWGTTLRYLGPTAGSDRSATLNADATLDVASNGTTLTLSGSLTGPGALVKAGPGSLALAGGSAQSGGTVIDAGVLQFNALGAISSAGITNNGATLRIATGGTLTLGNVLDLEGACTIDLNNTGGDTHLDGAWSGNATINVINQQNSSRTFTVGGNGTSNDTGGHGNLVELTGTISMTTNSGSLRFNDGGANYNTGSTNVTIDLGTGSATFLVRNGGLTIDVGALAGGPNTKVTGRGSGASGTVTYSVGGKNISTAFAGTITNSTSGNTTTITKVGTGTWTLSGVNTYTGPTIISNGVLALSGSGSIANTPSIDLVAGAVLDSTGRTDGTLTVASGQTLFGEGEVNGDLTVSSNATVSPGETSGVITKLTVTGALTVQPGGILAMDADFTSGTNDVIDGLASVTYGGTLSLSLLSIDLTASFKLFNAGSYHGAFDTITPASPSFGWVWDASSLPVNGTLKVKTLTAAGRPNVAVSATGSTLTLSGTGGPAYFNYTILASADVTQPLTSWTQVGTGNFKADGSFVINLPIDSNTPQQFYTIHYLSPQ
jgi:autotransporter-associated beta strand protein